MTAFIGAADVGIFAVCDGVVYVVVIVDGVFAFIAAAFVDGCCCFCHILQTVNVSLIIPRQRSWKE